MNQRIVTFYLECNLSITETAVDGRAASLDKAYKLKPMQYRLTIPYLSLIHILNIDLTDSGGAGLPAAQYLALGSGFVVKYSVGVGTAGDGKSRAGDLGGFASGA